MCEYHTQLDLFRLDDTRFRRIPYGEERNELQFNFNGEDYVYTSFKLNGKDVTSDLRNNSLRFTVDDDVLLQVDGSPKDFGTVDFTAYVMNPEGVTLYCGRFGENPADMSGGDAIEEELTIVPPGVPDEITMTSGDTKLYKLSVSAKNPYIYIAPAEGWYIRTVQSSSDGTKGGIPMASPDTPEFYVVAYKLGGYCKADINVHGSVPVRLSGSASLSNMWNNPATTYTIHEGRKTDLPSHCVRWNSLTISLSMSTESASRRMKTTVIRLSPGIPAISRRIPQSGRLSRCLPMDLCPARGK